MWLCGVRLSRDREGTVACLKFITYCVVYACYWPTLVDLARPPSADWRAP